MTGADHRNERDRPGLDQLPSPEALSRTDLAGVLVASILGSLVFGIVMSLTMGEVLLVAIPGMYGLAGISPFEAVFVGWAIHVSHGIVLGAVFGLALVAIPSVGNDTKRGLLAGIGYGALLWLTLATFLMPFWVGLTTPMEPPVPDPQPWSLVGHVLYGAFLGLLVPIYRRF